MPDIKAGLTKKIGPLPVWGYGLAVTGGLLGWKLLSGGDSETEFVATPTGAPPADPSYPSSGAFSQLVDRINDLENRGKEQPIPIANPQRPDSGGWGTVPRIPVPSKGGQIKRVNPPAPNFVAPLIPRSSKPTAPPPSSAPTRLARLPITVPTPKPVSAVAPKVTPPVKRVTTAVKAVAPKPVKAVAKAAPVKRAVTTPKPTLTTVKSAPRRLAPSAPRAVKPVAKPVAKKPTTVRRTSGARPI